jgi:uncharacterized protein YcgI (DUF1989 family)
MESKIIPLTKINAGTGAALRLDADQQVRLINTYGSQVVDTWCLSATDVSEYLSVEHTRRMLSRLSPREGDILYSNRRLGLLSIERDTAGCDHDMLLTCCDPWLYEFYGCAHGHANCRDNFLNALADRGIVPASVPNPINFWMNVPVRNGHVTLEPPKAKPGDFLVLRALRAVVIVFSACPMDITPVNGKDRTPRPVEYEVLDPSARTPAKP